MFTFQEASSAPKQGSVDEFYVVGDSLGSCVHTRAAAPAQPPPFGALSTVSAARLTPLPAAGRRGAFATVHQAVDRRSGKQVAVKMVDKRKFAIAARQMGSATHNKKRDLLRDEYNILRQLDHDNVVRVFDAFEDERTLFIVMEYVRGGELFDFIVDNGRFEEDAGRSIFRQMLQAVSWLHAKGISHRDLKPENILLQPKGSAYDAAPEQTTVDGWKVKISDFGECAAPVPSPLPHPLHTGMSRLVSKGSFMKTLAGTPHYLGEPPTTAHLAPRPPSDARSRQPPRSSPSRAGTARATTTAWTCGRSASSSTPCAQHHTTSSPCPHGVADRSSYPLLPSVPPA